jgi:hypothetical protein
MAQILEIEREGEEKRREGRKGQEKRGEDKRREEIYRPRTEEKGYSRSFQDPFCNK